MSRPYDTDPRPIVVLTILAQSDPTVPDDKGVRCVLCGNSMKLVDHRNVNLHTHRCPYALAQRWLLEWGISYA